MRRIFPSILAATLVAFVGWSAPSYAQPEDEEEMTFDPVDPNAPVEDAGGEEGGEGEGDEDLEFEPVDPTTEPEPDLPEPEPELPEPGAEGAVKAGAGAETALGENRVSWQDIVVVVRKPFLKQNRLELLPQWGVTMNDNIIRHVTFGGQLNYWLTDVLAVGAEGHLYLKDVREPFDLVARQARRLPTVNKYNWAAALNFHYVPIYGKFAVLDEHILHWESYFTAGVGVTQSEVLPRDPAYAAFKNTLITPNVGANMRFFITKFITVNVGIRDYIFVDKFEPVGRGPNMFESPTAAQDNADTALINNVVFQAGVSFWFPTSFEYTTFR